MPYALDNGFFHPPGEQPKDEAVMVPAFFAALRKSKAFHAPLFAVVPDVPYVGAESIKRSRKWIGELRAEFPGVRFAVAVQDGMDESSLDGFDALFVAGSTGWKWATASRWIAEAQRRGMWGHVARVNTKRGIWHCQDIGADSADGTGIWRGDRKQMQGVLDALVQPQLFAACGHGGCAESQQRNA